MLDVILLFVGCGNTRRYWSVNLSLMDSFDWLLPMIHFHSGNKYGDPLPQLTMLRSNLCRCGFGGASWDEYTRAGLGHTSSNSRSFIIIKAKYWFHRILYAFRFDSTKGSTIYSPTLEYTSGKTKFCKSLNRRKILLTVPRKVQQSFTLRKQTLRNLITRLLLLLCLLQTEWYTS